MMKKKEPEEVSEGWDTPWNRMVMKGLFNKHWDGYVEYCTGVSKGKPKNFLRYILDQEKDEKVADKVMGEREIKRRALRYQGRGKP